MPSQRAAAEEALTPGEAVYAEVDAGPGTHRRRRGPAVPLVPAPSPDSTRDTHTSLRRPSPHELASYAAESQAQRNAAPVTSHRRRALVRRRRMLAVLVAVVLLLAGAAAAYAAFATDRGGREGAAGGFVPATSTYSRTTPAPPL